MAVMYMISPFLTEEKNPTNFNNGDEFEYDM